MARMHICRTRSAQRAASCGEPRGQVGVDLAFRQRARALRRDAEQVRGARAVDQEEGAEDRRDEDGAAGVGAERRFERVRIRRARLPLAGLLVSAAERVAQRRAPSRRPAELLRELTEQVLAVEIAAGAADLALEDGRDR